jgi:glycosyltransferase involved in cell wall biosynthesis
MVKPTASVSIIAANYNNGRYLADFIGSIDQSTVLPKELIIIDDGSTDESLNVLGDFSSLSYLRIIKFERNRGFCIALNEGVKVATGEYIMRADPDDIITKDRIKIQVEFLESHKDIDVVGSNVMYFSNLTKKNLCKSNFPLNHASILKEYRNGDHGVQHPSTMIRARVMKKYVYDQKNVKAEDYELFARMIHDGYKFANIAQPLTKMRVHSQSVSSNIRYDTVKRTFEIRDEIFGTSTSKIKMKLYYYYISNYKKFLNSNNLGLKMFFLMASIICNPMKILKRFT